MQHTAADPGILPDVIRGDLYLPAGNAPPYRRITRNTFLNRYPQEWNPNESHQ
ncbi:hypothetical protein D3C76_1667810 [compost metagenome]|jgi:hypothetical protein